MENLTVIKIDPEVFKLKEARIAAVAGGRLSHERLVYTIRPGDWIVLYGDTVYALTDYEYYAAQAMAASRILRKDEFEAILSEDLNVSDKDKEQIAYIREHKKNCSTCRYNTFKATLLKVLRKYPELVSKYKLEDQIPEFPDYPETKSPVKPKVSKIFPKFFQVEPYERKPCLDCVEKHISMAYIKGCESLQGYPEHLPLAVANLEEAYEECPKDCPELRDLILFCIGKTKKDGKAFIPVDNLLYVIEMARQETQQEEALDENEADQNFALELSQDMQKELFNLPVIVKAEVIKQLDKLLKLLYNDSSKNLSSLYQGYMGNIADSLVAYCPDVSNVMRNRRLIFKAAPELVMNTEYDCKDVKRAMLQDENCSENVSSS